MKNKMRDILAFIFLIIFCPIICIILGIYNYGLFLMMFLLRIKSKD